MNPAESGMLAQGLAEIQPVDRIQQEIEEAKEVEKAKEKENCGAVDCSKMLNITSLKVSSEGTGRNEGVRKRDPSSLCSRARDDNEKQKQIGPALHAGPIW